MEAMHWIQKLMQPMFSFTRPAAIFQIGTTWYEKDTPTRMGSGWCTQCLHCHVWWPWINASRRRSRDREKWKKYEIVKATHTAWRRVPPSSLAAALGYVDPVSYSAAHLTPESSEKYEAEINTNNNDPLQLDPTRSTPVKFAWIHEYIFKNGLTAWSCVRYIL